jgi:hypothetical protein
MFFVNPSPEQRTAAACFEAGLELKALRRRKMWMRRILLI